MRHNTTPQRPITASALLAIFLISLSTLLSAGCASPRQVEIYVYGDRDSVQIAASVANAGR